MSIDLYGFAHYLRKKMPFIWDILELMNDILFTLFYSQRLRTIPETLKKNSGDIVFRYATINDIDNLKSFFDSQPEESYKFFQPHAFDKNTLTKLCKQKAFLMFIVEKKEHIVGYFFFRCSFTAKAFRGRIVDVNSRNQGIGKKMALCMNDIIKVLRFRQFATISPENYASLESVKAVNNIRIIKTIENGYYYIETLPK